MYGSQFHSQQALTTTRPSIEALQNKRYSLPSKCPKQKNFLAFIIVILIAILASNMAYAGPSSPRLKGGNGNANGR